MRARAIPAIETAEPLCWSRRFVPPMTSELSSVEDRQALALHGCISALMRQFRIEPGLLAGSVYANLHANDIGLFELLGTPESWSVRRIAQELGAPISTISSALDRLERQGLVVREHAKDDRRVVRVRFTGRGQRLAERLRHAHVENCRAMLVRLSTDQREELLRLTAKLAGK
jgi:DNA-binding MarR family transcriptional regulator